MRSIILGLLLPVLHLPAMAQAIFVGPDFIVQFYSEPCDVQELSDYMEQAGDVRRATVVHGGQRHQACYVTMPGGDYFVADVVGNEGRVERKQVRPGA